MDMQASKKEGRKSLVNQPKEKMEKLWVGKNPMWCAKKK